ncbi:hypothetical protein AMAG_06969 [Allomyces macrogynus ATCC 38327]|uniref:Uncharacterized protein n=1 Tax=Allomyces macrogynus (strain ATCC 38327) TaxID=578462 RepID=A0A0L0SFS3_ALLM3|nr:hypothetical protein AMAG_06969 [Allomyces macrogynus ATCC 38327]|eukprot:KNE61220.1 hypothetical protein AMAG_06969 [Allomyces macrogynus ATCC 38327]
MASPPQTATFSFGPAPVLLTTAGRIAGVFPPPIADTAPVLRLCSVAGGGPSCLPPGIPDATSALPWGPLASCLRARCDESRAKLVRATDTAAATSFTTATAAMNDNASDLISCALDQCAPDLAAATSVLCVPLTHPSLLASGVYLAQMPADTPPALASLFTGYDHAMAVARQAALTAAAAANSNPNSNNATARVALTLPPGTSGGVDPPMPDSRISPASPALVAPDWINLGVCLPTLPVGAPCTASSHTAGDIPTALTSGPVGAMAVGTDLVAIRKAILVNLARNTSDASRSGPASTWADPVLWPSTCQNGHVAAARRPGQSCSATTDCLSGGCSNSNCLSTGGLIADVPGTSPAASAINPQQDSGNGSGNSSSSAPSSSLIAFLVVFILVTILLCTVMALVLVRTCRRLRTRRKAASDAAAAAAADADWDRNAGNDARPLSYLSQANAAAAVSASINLKAPHLAAVKRERVLRPADSRMLDAVVAVTDPYFHFADPSLLPTRIVRPDRGIDIEVIIDADPLPAYVAPDTPMRARWSTTNSDAAAAAEDPDAPPQESPASPLADMPAPPPPAWVTDAISSDPSSSGTPPAASSSSAAPESDDDDDNAPIITLVLPPTGASSSSSTGPAPPPSPGAAGSSSSAISAASSSSAVSAAAAAAAARDRERRRRSKYSENRASTMSNYEPS